MTRPPASDVLLIGLRGSGKTSIGRMLAARLGRTFHDLDEEALALSDAGSVAEVFANRGEAEWRRLEARACRELLLRWGCVIALGGGAPMTVEIREAILAARARGTHRVVWLDADAEILAARLDDHGGERPALLEDDSGTPAGALEETARLRLMRAPTFAKLADFRIDCDAPPETVLERVVERLGIPPGDV